MYYTVRSTIGTWTKKIQEQLIQNSILLIFACEHYLKIFSSYIAIIWLIVCSIFFGSYIIYLQNIETLTSNWSDCHLDIAESLGVSQPRLPNNPIIGTKLITHIVPAPVQQRIATATEPPPCTEPLSTVS